MRSLTPYRRIVQAATVAAVSALLLTACAPGGNSEAGPVPSKPVSTGVGSEPVTLRLLVNSGVDVPFYTALGELFHAKYDNVTVKVENQDYATLTTNIAHILAGSNAPDLVRVSQLGNLIKDHLLTNLDPYAEAYGWDKWPQSQFASTRVGPDGKQRGTGSLYAAGPGFGLTGVYYNKSLAQRIGMTQPPATVAEFEQLLGKAKGAGLQPIMINGKDGGSVYPLQNLVMSAGGAQAVQDWNYAKPGASIDNAGDGDRRDDPAALGTSRIPAGRRERHRPDPGAGRVPQGQRRVLPERQLAGARTGQGRGRTVRVLPLPGRRCRWTVVRDDRRRQPGNPREVVRMPTSRPRSWTSCRRMRKRGRTRSPSAASCPRGLRTPPLQPRPKGRRSPPRSPRSRRC